MALFKNVAFVIVVGACIYKLTMGAALDRASVGTLPVYLPGPPPATPERQSGQGINLLDAFGLNGIPSFFGPVASEFPSRPTYSVATSAKPQVVTTAKPVKVHKPPSHAPHSEQYEAYMVEFPGYGSFVVLSEPGAKFQSKSHGQLGHRALGSVTLFPKSTPHNDVATPLTDAQLVESLYESKD